MHEQVLSVIQGKIKQIDTALGQVSNKSQQLGSDAGPDHLNHALSNIFPIDRINRIRRIGEVRRAIRETTIPLLQAQRATLQEQAEDSEKIHEDMEFVRQFANDGDITAEEASKAETEATAFLAGISMPQKPIKTAEKQQLPPEPWRMQPQVISVLRRLTDVEGRAGVEEFLRSERAEEIHRVVLKRHHSPSFRKQFAGVLFEEVGYTWLAKIYGGDTVLLSPQQVFELYKALYPHREVVNNEGISYSLRGVSIPDGFVIRNDADAVRIVAAVEYKNVNLQTRGTETAERIEKQAKNFTSGPITTQFSGMNGQVKKVLQQQLSELIPDITKKPFSVAVDMETIYITPVNTKLNLENISSGCVPINTSEIHQLLSALLKASNG